MRSSGRLLWILSALVCLALLISACGTLPAPTGTEEPPTVQPGTVPTPIQPGSPEPIPTVVPGTVAGEVPKDLRAAIIADAAARLGIDLEAFTVVRAEEVTWSDGSLGCPQPGVMYTQALVEGYRVVLEAGDQTLDYHAAQSGYFIRCEGSRLEPLGAPAGEPGLSPDQ